MISLIPEVLEEELRGMGLREVEPHGLEPQRLVLQDLWELRVELRVELWRLVHWSRLRKVFTLVCCWCD